MRALLVVSVILAARPAAAGYCLGDEEREIYLKNIEKYAADHKLPTDQGDTRLSLGVTCVVATKQKPMLDRAKAACTKIVAFAARGDDYATRVDDDCATFLVESGVGAVGKRDLVALVMARPASWSDEGVAPNFQALGGSGDPRVRGYLTGKLEAQAAKIGDKKLAGWRDTAWHDYRIAALGALEKVATPDDVPFLDKLATTDDARVKAAAVAAIAAAKSRHP